MEVELRDIIYYPVYLQIQFFGKGVHKGGGGGGTAQWSNNLSGFPLGDGTHVVSI